MSARQVVTKSLPSQFSTFATPTLTVGRYSSTSAILTLHLSPQLEDWYIGTSGTFGTSVPTSPPLLLLVHLEPWNMPLYPCTSVPIPPLLLFQLSQKSLVVHWYIGTSGTLGTSGALVHAPCTSVPIPPLLIFQLSQKIATSFTPT